MCLVCNQIAVDDAYLDWAGFCSEPAEEVARINLTTTREEVQLRPIQGCITVYAKDFCEQHEVLRCLPRLSILNFTGVKLCRHCDPSVADWLPRFKNVGSAFAAIAHQVKDIYVTDCNVCNTCVEEMGLEALINTENVMLSSNSLTEFPRSLYQLGSRLRYIDLAKNERLDLRSITKYIEQSAKENKQLCLPGLQELNISHCRLSHIPNQWLETFPHLIELSFDHNALKEMPGCLGYGLPHLRKVTGKHNCILHVDYVVLRRLANVKSDFKYNRENIDEMVQALRRQPVPEPEPDQQQNRPPPQPPQHPQDPPQEPQDPPQQPQDPPQQPQDPPQEPQDPPQQPQDPPQQPQDPPQEPQDPPQEPQDPPQQPQDPPQEPQELAQQRHHRHYHHQEQQKQDQHNNELEQTHRHTSTLYSSSGSGPAGQHSSRQQQATASCPSKRRVFPKTSSFFSTETLLTSKAHCAQSKTQTSRWTIPRACSATRKCSRNTGTGRSRRTG